MTEPDWRSWADALAVEVETLLGVPSAEDRADALQTLRDYDAASRHWQAVEEERARQDIRTDIRTDQGQTRTGTSGAAPGRCPPPEP